MTVVGALTNKPKDFVPTFFGKIDVEDNQSRPGSVVTPVCSLEKCEGRQPIGNDMNVSCDAGAFEGFADQEHIRRIVLSDQDMKGPAGAARFNGGWRIERPIRGRVRIRPRSAPDNGQ